MKEKQRTRESWKLATSGERAAVSGSWASVRRGMQERRAAPFRMAGPGRTRTAAERDLAHEKRSGKPTALETAQDLVYQAWEAPRSERAALAEKALELSKSCADAYLVLAEASFDLEERLALCRSAVQAGRTATRKVDASSFQDAWESLELRPLLRARAGRARANWELGRLEAAVKEYGELMEMNPGDNLGLRYLVLPLLIELDFTDEAARVLERWGGEPSAEWEYNHALLLFRLDGRSLGARKALKEAMQHNRMIPEYLLGLCQIPATLPDTIAFGGEDQAIDYALRARGAWEAVDGALDWLGEEMLAAAV